MHADFVVGPEDVRLVTRPDRMGNMVGSGVAYVTFASPAVARDAQAARHRKMIGTRYIELMSCAPGELWSRRHSPCLPCCRPTASFGGSAVWSPACCVHMQRCGLGRICTMS